MAKSLRSKPILSHVEILSGVIRLGPDITHFGAPFDIAVAFASVDNKVAVLKALCEPGRLTKAHVKEAIAAVARLNLTAHWERARDIEIEEFNETGIPPLLPASTINSK